MLEKEKVILEENILLDSKPFVLTVELIDINQQELVYVFGKNIDIYGCEVKNIYDNGELRSGFYIDNLISKKCKIDLSQKYGFTLRSIMGETGYVKPFLYGIKKCINVNKEEIVNLPPHERKVIDPGKEISHDQHLFAKLRVISEDFVIYDKIREWDDGSGKNRDEIDKSIYLLLEEFLLHFGVFKRQGLYLSSEFSLKEINRSIDYFKRKDWVDELKGSINLHSNKKDEAYEVLGIGNKTNFPLNSLFTNVKLPYSEKDIVFVIMPFSDEKFKWLGEETDDSSLRSFISEKSKAKCVTVADDKTSRNILNKIYSHLSACKFAIADIATLNPNVLYEIGIANSLGKSVILICSKEELEKLDPQLKKGDLFSKFLNKLFDLNHNSIFDYESDEDIRDKLAESIEQTLRTL